MDLELLYNKFDQTIRNGEITSVQNQIENLNPQSIPRKLAAGFADIARRVRSENCGLRLMRSIVRSDPPIFPKPTPDELCIYAGLLIKVGALPEAKKILSELDPNTTANVDIFLGQINIAQWNYKEAVPHYKKVIARKGLNNYLHAIAQVNLACAYVFLEKLTDAKKILPELIHACASQKWELLHANALEISAQMAVMQKEWNEAKRLLTEAEMGAGQHSHYRIFIEKWTALAELAKAQDEKTSIEKELAKILQIRSNAQALRSWETIRDLDYYLALYQNHENLLLNVYFGTPHLAYKKRIQKIFKQKGWLIPKFYFRKLTEAPAERLLDLATATEVGRTMTEPINPGQLLHRLLNILAMDFYKPIGMGELFSKLYPDEYFNPDVAPGRVTQAVKILRKWFATNQIPIEVAVDNNRFSLIATEPYALKISNTPTSSNDLQSAGLKNQLMRLKEKWPYQSFSAPQAAKELQISPSSAQKIIVKALSQNLMFTSGAGRSTQYRFEK